MKFRVPVKLAWVERLILLLRWLKNFLAVSVWSSCLCVIYSVSGLAEMKQSTTHLSFRRHIRLMKKVTVVWRPYSYHYRLLVRFSIRRLSECKAFRLMQWRLAKVGVLIILSLIQRIRPRHPDSLKFRGLSFQSDYTLCFLIFAFIFDRFRSKSIINDQKQSLW